MIPDVEAAHIGNELHALAQRIEAMKAALPRGSDVPQFDTALEQVRSAHTAMVDGRAKLHADVKRALA